MIELNDFTIGFGSRTLIKDASVSFPSRKMTALVGRNGTGKSTLLRAIAGLMGRYRGSVMVNGHEVRHTSHAILARQLAFVTTERTRIPNLTSRDVVATGRAPYTDWMGRLGRQDYEIVDNALAAVGMEMFAHRCLDTMSDGECQRIMIARALAQQTPVILLDEPTSFLDVPSRAELCRLLATLAHDSGKCILFSTHEIEIAMKYSDNIAIIDTPELTIDNVTSTVSSGKLEQVFKVGTDL